MSSSAGSCAGSIRPCASTGATMKRFIPKPSTRSAFFTVMCASSEITTFTSGAPIRPSASTSQPLRASSAPRGHQRDERAGRRARAEPDRAAFGQSEHVDDPARGRRSIVAATGEFA